MPEKNQHKKQRSPYIYTVVIFLIVATMIAAFGVYKFWDSTKESTTIVNLSSIVPPYVKTDIEKKLYQNVLKNSENYQDNRSVLKAKVRSNTLNAGTKDDGEGYGTFIVDIDQLEQNYRIYYEYRDKNDFETRVSCVEQENSYYPASSCRAVGDETDYDAYEKLDLELPYIGRTKNGRRFYVGKSLRYAYTGKPYLEIDVNSCNDQTVLNSGLTVFKEYLTSEGYDPDTFTFELRDKCYLEI